MDRDIHIAVLPGHRLPAGTHLPADIPYTWHGIKTTSWACVAVLVLTELVPAITVLDDVGSDRVMWLTVQADDNTERAAPLVICAFYAAPGGDVATWSDIIADYCIIAVLKKALAHVPQVHF